jgi:hypothetical protein
VRPRPHRMGANPQHDVRRVLHAPGAAERLGCSPHGRRS